MSRARPRFRGHRDFCCGPPRRHNETDGIRGYSRHCLGRRPRQPPGGLGRRPQVDGRRLAGLGQEQDRASPTGHDHGGGSRAGEGPLRRLPEPLRRVDRSGLGPHRPCRHPSVLLDNDADHIDSDHDDGDYDHPDELHEHVHYDHCHDHDLDVDHDAQALHVGLLLHACALRQPRACSRAAPVGEEHRVVRLRWADGVQRRADVVEPGSDVHAVAGTLAADADRDRAGASEFARCEGQPAGEVDQREGLHGVLGPSDRRWSIQMARLGREGGPGHGVSPRAPSGPPPNRARRLRQWLLLPHLQVGAAEVRPHRQCAERWLSGLGLSDRGHEQGPVPCEADLRRLHLKGQVLQEDGVG
mmetsp:Transcript_134076/g.388075  ORF Transcript_134076/g.388075 Transcript_134076/m.388075 type:complete len:357 (+) Transcript_134076:199-1269(+)